MSSSIHHVIAQMADYGITGLEASSIILDGNIHRFKPDGDKTQSGWYQLSAVSRDDGSEMIIGAFGRWDGVDNGKVAVKSVGGKLSAAEKKEYDAKRIAQKKAADYDKARKAKAARRLADQTYIRASIEGESDYLKRKQVQSHGLKYAKKGFLFKTDTSNGIPVNDKTLIVPVQDIAGAIKGLQFILNEKLGGKEDKFFWPRGMSMEGGMYRIGPKPEADGFILIAEGYATAASLYEASNITTYAAFNCGNLMPVALSLRSVYPNVRIIICADDDWQRTNSRGDLENIGLVKADAAAEKVGGYVIKPRFKHRTPENGKAFVDFNDLAVSEGLSAVAALVKDKVDSLQDWTKRLAQRADGRGYQSTLNNMSIILNNDPHLTKSVAYDLLSQRVAIAKPLPWDSPEKHWTDAETTRLRCWLEAKYGIAIKTNDCDAVIDMVAKNHAFHPVRDYLETCVWDQMPRLNDLARDALGSPDDEYHQFVLRKWMIGAVARVYEPGCKMDTMIVLEGEQGIKKSSFLRDLASSKWFSDTGFDMRDKDSKQQLQGIWIYEMAELDSHNKAESTLSKLFLSTQVDNYRQSYGRRNELFHRQVVFAGTTNQREYLKDPTGARRYWPVICNEINLKYVTTYRDQLWAEAVQAYKDGERWYAHTVDEQEMVRKAQEMRYLADSWEDMIRVWLSNRASQGVTMGEILTSALNFAPNQIKRADEVRAGVIMQRLGWAKKRRWVGGERVYLYVNTAKGEDDMAAP